MPYKDPAKRREYMAGYRANNREKIKAWFSRNPTKTRTYDLHVWDRKLGFKIGTMERLFANQQVCELCGLPFEDAHGLSPVPDHNHITNQFRGILHSNCNVGLGLLGDSASRCLQASEYLKRHRSLS